MNQHAKIDDIQPPLAGRRVVLGITGGIAAYKAADLASKLVQAGARVETILTKSAQEFVRPLTFSALTRQPVHSDTFEAWTEGTAGHITLGHGADALVIAPATANTIARLALGLADDRAPGEGTLDQIRGDLDALETLGAAYVIFDPFPPRADGHATRLAEIERAAAQIIDLR
jgi:hypothetical protein